MFQFIGEDFTGHEQHVCSLKLQNNVWQDKSEQNKNTKQCKEEKATNMRKDE